MKEYIIEDAGRFPLSGTGHPPDATGISRAIAKDSTGQSVAVMNYEGSDHAKDLESCKKRLRRMMADYGWTETA